MLDHRIGAGAHAGAEEYFLDVFQAARLAVQVISADAITEQASGDRDLIRVDARQGVLQLVHHQRHLAKRHALTRRTAVEDDVSHVFAAQRLGTLLTDDPLDRIDHVRLTAPVGPNDRGDALFEIEGQPIGKGFESVGFESAQTHQGGRC